ncbi:MAG: DUF2975 domain-containing protein [Lachnospiraceae bacterium]|nr:DUF2975 domain-containing protein [Lachnospiraceae bacterium]
MKEEAIKKINSIGKISGFITLIAKVLVGIAIAAVLVGTVIFMCLPDSMIKISTTADVSMEIDYSAVGITISDEQMAEAKAQLERDIVEQDGEGFTSVEVTPGVVRMSGAVEEFEFTMKIVVELLVLALITLILTFVTLIFVGRLCKAFRDCQSPFEENVIRKMQHFAYALIPWAVISTITMSITESLMSKKVIVNFNFDLRTILIVLVVLVLVYIFKYGAMLQQESDETL